MKAKEKGAKLIHVDPRFTRTSAVADIYVPIRGGLRHRLPGRPDQLGHSERQVLQGVRRQLHQRRDDHQCRTISDTEDLDGRLLGLQRRDDARRTTTPAWQYDRTQVQQSQRARRHRSRAGRQQPQQPDGGGFDAAMARRHVAELRRAGQSACCRRREQTRPDAAGPATASSRS